MATIYPVIMAGGSGTRLWPVSRSHQPKQFQAMLGKTSMFQDTLARLSGSIGDHFFAAPSVIGGVRFADLIKDQLASAGHSPHAVILEPFGRNTAAVASIAAALPGDDDALVLLMPSDAYMADPGAFRDAVGTAADTAIKGFITTFGIKPTHPETGYGYIEAGAEIGSRTSAIQAFQEKPDLETAKTYFANPSFAWNAGIFLFPANTMAEEMEAYAPDIHAAALSALGAAAPHGEALVLDPELFKTVRDESIDYAVMEKTQKGAVCGPLVCGWSDIGSWGAIANLSESKTVGDVIDVGTRGCYLRSDGETLVAAIGVEDLVIIAHEGAILVAPRERSQDVKTVVNTLKAQGRKDRL
ncbi:MAG: sugar phosphate nucleotidyltransferase [Pseudomonadota bacterium]